MITYTKKNVILVTLVITIVLFFLCFILHSLSLSILKILPKVYEKQISLEETEPIIETSEEKIEPKTQRQWIQEYKNVQWRIQIPKINLDVHIAEGATLEVMLTAVGHFEETSKWNGNVGLAAHNRGQQCNFFENIKNLKVGDEIIYITTNGKKVYQVQTNKVILETDWSYLEPTKDNRITLITCEENRKEYRRCVQAIEVVSQNRQMEV